MQNNERAIQITTLNGIQNSLRSLSKERTSFKPHLLYLVILLLIQNHSRAQLFIRSRNKTKLLIKRLFPF